MRRRRLCAALQRRHSVATDTGFGGLLSTQCTFSTTMQAYQEHAYAEMAGMMAAAGLTPWLQFGEFLWWYYARVQNLAIGYASDTAPISIGTATPHELLTGQGVLTAGVQGDTAANTETTATVIDSTHLTLDGSSRQRNLCRRDWHDQRRRNGILRCLHSVRCRDGAWQASGIVLDAGRRSHAAR